MIDVLVRASWQGALLTVALSLALLLFPRISPDAKAWLWRLVLLKFVIDLLPGIAIELRLLPPVETAPAVSFAAANAQYASPATEVRDPSVLLLGIGAALFVLWTLFGWVRARRILDKAYPDSNPETLNGLDRLLMKVDCRRSARLLRSCCIEVPLLLQGRVAKVVLPASAKEDDARMMLAHEVAHLSRRDLEWRLIASAVRSLFFFHPLVWWAVSRLDLAQESATDELATRLAGVSVGDYADMLVRVTVNMPRGFAPHSAGLSMAQSYRNVQRRLHAMKHFSAPPSFAARAATAALMMATIALLPAYQVGHRQPATPPPVPNVVAPGSPVGQVIAPPPAAAPLAGVPVPRTPQSGLAPTKPDTRRARRSRSNRRSAPGNRLGIPVPAAPPRLLAPAASDRGGVLDPTRAPSPPGLVPAPAIPRRGRAADPSRISPAPRAMPGVPRLSPGTQPGPPPPVGPSGSRLAPGAAVPATPAARTPRQRRIPVLSDIPIIGRLFIIEDQEIVPANQDPEVVPGQLSPQPSTGSPNPVPAVNSKPGNP